MITFIIAALTADGFIAKKYPSIMRSIIDFFADKLLVNIAAIALVFNGIIPYWAALIFAARDMLTIVGGIFLLYKDLRREFKPTVIGKISYFFQIMALIPPIINREADWYLMSAALAFTVVSGIYSLIKSEFRFARRKTDLDEFKMFRLIKLADIFTLFNVALGLMSIVFSIENDFSYAAFVLLIAVAFDYLDGKIAKVLHQQNDFGKELDSLADTISFGVAPAIFGFSLMQDSTLISQPGLMFGIITLSDKLDGISARVMNQMTEFGSIFDSFTDWVFVVTTIFLFIDAKYITKLYAFLVIFPIILISLIKIYNLKKYKRIVKPTISTISVGLAYATILALLVDFVYKNIFLTIGLISIYMALVAFIFRTVTAKK